jgi:3',5'-nucleoside bisphosphate phosphatase
VIDLHTHTTASDGRTAPEALPAEALAAGVRILAVTDHDTMGGLAGVAAAATGTGVRIVPGIEITAVHEGRDVHVLGYYLDAACRELIAFLEAQRADRRRRMTEIIAALDRLGAPVDAAPLFLRATVAGRAVGRPLVAEALVAAGHARDIGDAFDRFLAEGRPAFIERIGPTPGAVVSIIGRAGGLASLAHPGKTRVDALVGELAAAGLPAIEVYHPDHDPKTTDRYREMAARYELLATGGSDYHGPGSGRDTAFGRTGLPPADFARLEARAGAR